MDLDSCAEHILLWKRKIDKKRKVDEIRKKQDALFESYHEIVLSPIVLNTLANIEANITNGSFETLLQLLKTYAEVKTHVYYRHTIIYSTTLASNDKLRKFTSLYRKAKDDKEKLLEKIKEQFGILMKKSFQKFISDEIPTVERVRSLVRNHQNSLEQWCIQPDIVEVNNLFRQTNRCENLKTIAQPKTPLQNANIHPSLTIMMKNIDEFEPFLKTILKKCGAINERIQYDLDTPLHYAVRSQNTGFIEWLLDQPSLDVNCRNKQMKTALFVLCEQSKAALRKKEVGHLKKYRKHILLLLARGADFNICSSKGVLPFELLTQNGKSNDQLQSEQHDFCAQCEEVVQRRMGCPILKRRDNKFTTKQFETITIELLEIFLRFKDQELFENLFQKLYIQDADVCKVITLLLHPAVELNLQKCVDLVLGRYGKLIFDTVSDKPFLKYRVQLKRLLRKACDSFNPDILKKLLCQMEKDELLINDESILVYTLNQCANLSDGRASKESLLECTKLMATDPRILNTKTDCYGNTALHLAVKFGFTEIAESLITDQKFMFLGTRNVRGESILDLASYEFCCSYFDYCAKQINSGDILINLNGINPFGLEKFYDHFLEAPKVHTQKESNRRNFRSEMSCLEIISNSVNLKQLLHHPVIYSFILIKWLRFSMWHCFNLILTIGISYCWFSIECICHENFSITLYIARWCVFCFIVFLGLLQLIIFGSEYFGPIQNWIYMINILGMFLVLLLSNGSIVFSLLKIVFAIQIFELIESLSFISISTYRCMFRVVALKFFKSIVLFCPLMLSFIYTYFLFNNLSSQGQYPFASANDTTIKITVMETGEFEASSIEINAAVFLILVLCVCFVFIILQELIIGSVGIDISEIRKESELISLCEKVKLLSRFESGLNRNSRYKAINYVLKRLRNHAPDLFFMNYHHVIKIVVNERARIFVCPRDSRRSFSKTLSLNSMNCLSQQFNSSEGTVKGSSLNLSQSKNQKSSKNRWKFISRIAPLGLGSPIATLEGTVLEELLSIVNRNKTSDMPHNQKPFI